MLKNNSIMGGFALGLAFTSVLKLEQSSHKELVSGVLNGNEALEIPEIAQAIDILPCIESCLSRQGEEASTNNSPEFEDIGLPSIKTLPLESIIAQGIIVGGHENAISQARLQEQFIEYKNEFGKILAWIEGSKLNLESGTQGELPLRLELNSEMKARASVLCQRVFDSMLEAQESELDPHQKLKFFQLMVRCKFYFGYYVFDQGYAKLEGDPYTTYAKARENEIISVTKKIYPETLRPLKVTGKIDFDILKSVLSNELGKILSAEENGYISDSMVFSHKQYLVEGLKYALVPNHNFISDPSHPTLVDHNKKVHELIEWIKEFEFIDLKLEGELKV